MVIRSRGLQIGDFKPKKCRNHMYYYRMYSIYPEKCDPGGKGTGIEQALTSYLDLQSHSFPVFLLERKLRIWNMVCDSTEVEHRGQRLE
jgi:hypothetical protein